MARCINDLTKYNCKPNLGTITGRLAKEQTTKWTPEQALAFIEEQTYPLEGMAKIAKRNVR